MVKQFILVTILALTLGMLPLGIQDSPDPYSIMDLIEVAWIGDDPDPCRAGTELCVVVDDSNPF